METLFVLMNVCICFALFMEKKEKEEKEFREYFIWAGVEGQVQG